MAPDPGGGCVVNLVQRILVEVLSLLIKFVITLDNDLNPPRHEIRRH